MTTRPKASPPRHVRRPPPAPVLYSSLWRLLWIIPVIILLGALTVAGALVRDEMQTSRLQAQWLSYYDSFIHFSMKPGPNPQMRYPAAGPYNQRLGYSYLPFFAKALSAEDYAVAAQARGSRMYDYFLDRGLYPIYRAKTMAGLSLYDETGKPVYSASYPNHVFTKFDAVPPLLTDTLLYIENRELLLPGPATHNPVIEWKRFFSAAVGFALKRVDPGLAANAGGGSTLATQIEKFRFSPGGETRSGIEKLRQIVSASLRVYLDGPDTRAARKQIVLDYLNSTPLGARAGFGEVNGLGDGLWAWFGIDLNDAITALNLPDTDTDSVRAKAHIYRMALGLILAQRRPAYYLATNHAALDTLTDATLDRLAEAKVIAPALRDAAKSARFSFLADTPPLPQPPFIEQKAVNALRSHLLSMLGLSKLYELDRLDLSARSTLDQPTEQKTVAFLKKMGDRDFLKSIGLYGFRLLDEDNDPAKIKWSVVLYEKDQGENKIRVQADNVDQPFDMNEGMKLDLGSTAKLRTLVSYLEIVSELYRRYAGLDADDLRELARDAPDPLTDWATGWLASRPDATLDEMLDAAMDRRYSGNPGETFFTGGGEHHFNNFEKEEDHKIMAVRDAFKDSVNLVFVRLMRDIVNYTMAQGPQTKQELMEDSERAARRVYLERFADSEGSVFLNRFIADYENMTPDQVLDHLAERGHQSATARTVMFRSIRPKGGLGEYEAFMARHPAKIARDESDLTKLYKNYPAERYNLADRAYVAGVHPLELWLAGYLQSNPHATRRQILAVSQPVRIESYAWLFRPSLKRAQDTRIRIILEEDAFAHIQKRWARLGYPFEHLVPSYATAIGSSADRPDALAELVGIILNDGVRQPVVRFDTMQFGADTPYETLFQHQGDKRAQQVLEPAVAHAVKKAMVVVAEQGTGKRIKGTYLDAQGQPYLIGGKTGTGDHRFDEFGAGGRLISSRVVNRTGTFAFFIGDRFFGTIVGHVAGEDAADYRFSSALAVQVLKSLQPILQPLINGTDTTLATVPTAPVQKQP